MEEKNSKILDCTVAYNKYGAYCVPNSAVNRPAADLVKSNKIYEPDTIDFMRQNSGDGSIIHAGTFFGDFLPALSQAISASNKIYAFEPNLESYRCAQITCLLNRLENVELVFGGLGKENSAAQILTKNKKGRSLGGASKILKVPLDQVKGETQEVNIYALDNVVPSDEKISILQLDVEGYEQFAMEGASSIIDKWKPIIILENNPPDEWMEEHLFSKNYSFAQKLHHNKVFKAQ